MWSIADRRRWWRRASLLLPALVLGGCASAGIGSVKCRSAPAATSAAAVYRAAPGSTMEALVPGANALLLSPALGDRVAVHDVRLESSATGFARVRVDLASCSAAPQVLRLRTQFLDAAGRRSEPVTVWRDVLVGPGSLADYDEFATQPASVAFRVEIDSVGR